MNPLSFFSSIHISERIEAFREAERNLLEFSKTRFAHSHQDIDCNGDAATGTPKSSNNHLFELFDTPVKIPSVIPQGAASSCQIHRNDDCDDSCYSLHGIKVINKRLSSSFGNDNEKTATAATTKAKAPLVLLHGYANGSLYFYRNLMGLSHHFESIYALDMLGWGLSSRPKFDLLHNTDGENANNSKNRASIASQTTSQVEQQKVSCAESFFVESLESWRKHHNLPKLTLAGHSMGGYLSVAYAERYPQHVERLILLSPVGVPEKPPIKEESTRMNSLPFHIRAMIKTSRYLFQKGVTPGSFLRSLPYSKSKAMVDGYILNRLPAISCPEERKHLSEYLYQNSMLPGSGEYCLSEILTAGAFAKVPLVHRIPEIASNKEGGEDGMEVHMVYGQRDWMDWRGGVEVQRSCHEKRLQWERNREQSKLEDKQQLLNLNEIGSGKTTAQNNTNSNNGPPPRIFVHGVKDASHLLMLDNFEEFNSAIIVAAGEEESLPSNMPRPIEVVCDEILSSEVSFRGSNKQSASGQSNVVGEEGAAAFFHGPRWNRDPQEKMQEADGTSRSEEKKVEEERLS